MQTMKRISLRAVVALTLFASSLAFAATPTVEPSLPADIATWEKHETTCDKNPGKMLGQTVYIKQADDGEMLIIVTTLNGKPVVQIEGTVAEGDFLPIARLYQRNTPEKNWLLYQLNSPSIFREARPQLLSELGLTEEQFMRCKK